MHKSKSKSETKSETSFMPCGVEVSARTLLVALGDSARCQTFEHSLEIFLEILKVVLG